MAHTTRDKQKLLARVRRIKGQIEAVDRAIDAEENCTVILHAVAACHGAIKGLMVEIMEGHIRHHVVDPDLQPTTEQSQAAQELIDVLKSYLK